MLSTEDKIISKYSDISKTLGSVQKAREAYLIERGKTLETIGINQKDEM